jgi:hypothetical protein
MNNKVTVVNCETGETFERDLTPEEIRINEMQDEKYQQQIAEAEAKATARQALLTRLGITEEEARILLGGN